AIESGDAWTLQEAYERTCATVWDDSLGGTASSKNAMRHIMTFMGPGIRVQDITLDKIDEYVTSLVRRGLGNATINRHLMNLSRVLRTAYERGKLDRMPAIKLRKPSQHRIRFLTDDEEIRLFNTLSLLGYHEQREFFMVLLYTGFRCGELAALRSTDVNLETNTLTVWKSKGGRPRTIPIVSKIQDIIIQRAHAGPDFVFPNCTRSSIHRSWSKARHMMQLDEDKQFIPHMLRHTCATRMARAGVPLTVIQAWLGHADIKMTMRYAHFAPSDLLTAATILGR
ncbi:MAG: tyrosine-type recombinase/integrase, partial [Desulfovibrionaceae bacterium]|nr:tyrosine-type recombinase/integrase [Desulfovibrionaceae bacterium]